MKRTKPAARKPKSPGLVFVVDDNVLLGEYAGAVLKSAGYGVELFNDPKALLQALGQTKLKPKILVTDFEMGEMNGLELIAATQKIQPKLKTLLLSGTIDHDFVTRHRGKVDGFIAKPYKPAQLTEKVGQILET